MELNLLKNWWQLLLLAVISYFIGCFNFAVMISRFKKKDITKIGSGNPGTMNMSREFGAWVGIATFFLDAFKGGVPAVIIYFIYKNYVIAGTSVPVGDVMRFWCGMFIVIGHVFPVTMHFKGGKGVASAIGLFWMCLGTENPWFLLIGFAIVCTMPISITLAKYGSLCSLIYVGSFACWLMMIILGRTAGTNGYVAWVLLMIFTIVALVWGAHHKNWVRIFSGEEHSTSFFKKKKKKS